MKERERQRKCQKVRKRGFFRGADESELKSVRVKFLPYQSWE
jgi:hypothetical protein